ncbi:MAG: hypothetical protein RMX61_02710, partial [Planktomarina sp.]|nr:hypothetical protein [Planktomarina sp.]
PAASVRSEPGSNSQVEIHCCITLTFEPLHIVPLFRRDIISVYCASVSKRNKNLTNSEADLTSSDTLKRSSPSKSICSCLFIE